MSKRPHGHLAAQLAFAGLAAIHGPQATAQSAPDAGRILQEQPKPSLVPQAQPKPAPAAPPVAVPDDTGPRIKVNAIRIQGAVLIPESELAAQVQPLVGRELSLGQLQAGALALVGHYAAKGYLARVYLPEQDIKDGTVVYRVVEGTRGALSVAGGGPRLDSNRVRAFVDARVAPGAPMNLTAFGEAMSILNEQPGVDVKADLSPGQRESAVDLAVIARESPPVRYSLAADNHGSRGTGEAQVNGGVTLNNPTGRFDAAGLLLNVAEGSAFVRGDYSLAVGDRGARMGVNASHLQYRIVQPAFRALGAKGHAQTLGLAASYPLARRFDFNLSLVGTLDHKRLVDETAAGETGRRIVNVANIGFSGFTALVGDALSGILSFGVKATVGDVDQRNAAALADDRLGRRVQGSFWKATYYLTLFKPLADDWALSGTVRGQTAQKNLDSSERFSLGGVGGIRAYPTAEGLGDEGWMVNVDLVRRIAETLSVSAFVDAGQTTVHHTVPAAGLVGPNRYRLHGAGFSVDWQPQRGTSISVTLAAPIGNNPGQDAMGHNSDGRKNNPRVWLSATTQF